MSDIDINVFLYHLLSFIVMSFLLRNFYKVRQNAKQNPSNGKNSFLGPIFSLWSTNFVVFGTTQQTTHIKNNSNSL